MTIHPPPIPWNDLTYDGFRQLALAEGLSPHERIGFPVSYREGYEDDIFEDIRHKLCNLDRPNAIVLDIGCGCAGLPRRLIRHGHQLGHRVLLCDSAEMLDLLPDEPTVLKIAGRFPVETSAALRPFVGTLDVILAYSVIQYVFVERSVFEFLDACCELLAPGGQFLIGDIPNIGKRKRFFASPAGIRHHQQFTRTEEIPRVEFNRPEPGKIDDAIVLALLARARAAGFDSYLLPQSPRLPMANRREDILIVRP